MKLKCLLLPTTTTSSCHYKLIMQSLKTLHHRLLTKVVNLCNVKPIHDDLDIIRFGQQIWCMPKFVKWYWCKKNLFEVYFSPPHKGLHWNDIKCQSFEMRFLILSSYQSFIFKGYNNFIMWHLNLMFFEFIFYPLERAFQHCIKIFNQKLIQLFKTSFKWLWIILTFSFLTLEMAIFYATHHCFDNATSLDYSAL
jgi:hypothetical protein